MFLSKEMTPLLGYSTGKLIKFLLISGQIIFTQTLPEVQGKYMFKSYSIVEFNSHLDFA